MTYEQLQAQYHEKGESDRAFYQRVQKAGGVAAFMAKWTPRRRKGKG